MLIINFRYTMAEHVKTMPPEDYAELQSLVYTARNLKQDERYWNVPEFRATYEELDAIAHLIPPDIIEIKGVAGTQITRMKDHPEKVAEVTADALRSGAAVQITIADVGLLQINKVDYLEDECTDRLQGYLNDGWRILAVCPPNAQRRPTYIIGRHETKDR